MGERKVLKGQIGDIGPYQIGVRTTLEGPYVVDLVLFTDKNWRRGSAKDNLISALVKCDTEDDAREVHFYYVTGGHKECIEMARKYLEDSRLWPKSR